MLRYKKIFLGGSCNNNCIYCPSDHKNSPLADPGIIRNLLEKEKSDSVVFFGGEPTVRDDLLQIITSAKGMRYRRIKLITNGRLLSNMLYLEQLFNAGCSLFEITLWGSNPNLHDYLSGMTGSFRETFKGLENLSGIPQEKFICIRIPVCKENLPDIENCTITALNAGAHRIILSMRDHSLTFQSALPHISNSVNISIFNRVWILTEGVPFCLMQGLEQHISEVYSGWDDIYQTPRLKNNFCLGCIYEKLCSGPEAAYIRKFGNKEFTPVTNSKFFEEIKALRE